MIPSPKRLFCRITAVLRRKLAMSRRSWGFGSHESPCCAGDECVRVGKPLLKRYLIPHNGCLDERFGVRKPGRLSGGSPKNPLQFWAFSIFFQGMAAPMHRFSKTSLPRAGSPGSLACAIEPAGRDGIWCVHWVKAGTSASVMRAFQWIIRYCGNGISRDLFPVRSLP